VLRPRLTALGVPSLLDVNRNNLVVRLGAQPGSRALLFQTYTPAQHHNLMEDPFSGRAGDGREVGIEGLVVHGQGVSQAKAHQAVMLAVTKMLLETGTELAGSLLWSINNEGRSSHACSEAILDALPVRPHWAVLLIGSAMDITLGNRGRVDIEVVVEGRAAHSSTPELGLNAIEAASDIVRSLRRLIWTSEHPQLGQRHAHVYKIRYEPLAPHTLPSRAELMIDRRLLPGDTVEGAVREIRDVIGDLTPFRVSVRPTVTMVPALVPPDAPVVQSLQTSYLAVRGERAREIIYSGSFDAGGLVERGIPTIMWGAGGRGDWPLGRDFVAVEDVIDEARVIAHLIIEELAP
jgi:acetylornithine deacetylase/succinyl-diaminopimelate desuccinylase-like protein